MALVTQTSAQKTNGQIVLGVGDWGVTNSAGSTLKTFGLGSCVAVLCYDKALKMAGMVHVALPDSNLAQETVLKKPGYCADTGMEILFGEMQRRGSKLKAGTVLVKLAGGASILDPNGTFNIGKRNILTVKKLLWARGLGPIGEEVGGTISRTVTIAADDGAVTISTPGMESRSL